MSEKSDSAVNAPEEEILTLQDVLDQEAELEQECAAVLGGSDDKCCTYSKGYIKRQALYACITCTPEARTDPTKRAGVCLACSYNCHEGHEMVELYTKRSFRCDCGTAKILAVRCRLDNKKLEQNDDNKYNQNFSGVYCSCHRPYPDPEDPIDDEMIQCVICEDWYHCRHLLSTVPAMNEFTEMVCAPCMDEVEFLQNYTGLSIVADDISEQKTNSKEDDSLNVTSTTNEPDRSMEEDDLDVTNDPDKDRTDDGVDVNSSTDVPVAEVKVDEQLTDEINQCIMDIIEINKSNGESNEEDECEPPTKKQKLTDASEKSIPNGNASVEMANVRDGERDEICKMPPPPTQKLVGATFWPHDWRLNLCPCAKCVVMMKSLKVEYLLDQEDTVLCYQEKGMAKVGSCSYDRSMAALSRLDRVSQIEAIMKYNKMKQKLVEFLNAFVTSQQVVTEDDINRFFRMMNEKTDGGGDGGASS